MCLRCKDEYIWKQQAYTHSNPCITMYTEGYEFEIHMVARELLVFLYLMLRSHCER